jgi:putative two-component system response regulator
LRGLVTGPRDPRPRRGRSRSAGGRAQPHDRPSPHAGVGARRVASLGDPALTEIVRHHHERLDGSGYPDRLRGDEIPLGARIIAVADTFDAITSCRPYRDANSSAAAIGIILKESGTAFDGRVVAAFAA